MPIFSLEGAAAPLPPPPPPSLKIHNRVAALNEVASGWEYLECKEPSIGAILMALASFLASSSCSTHISLMWYVTEVDSVATETWFKFYILMTYLKYSSLLITYRY